MPIKKYITTVVMLIVLHHSLATGANGEETSFPSATTQQQESQTSREPPSDTALPAATAPIVESIQSSPSDTLLEPEIYGPKIGFFDELHVKISEQLLTTAVWLDSFFADERSIQEDNRSYIRARYDTFTEERSHATFKPTVNLRLALPELEKKAHIVVSAEPAETPASSPSSPSVPTDRIGPKEDRNVTTAVNYILRATEEQNFAIRSGAQFTHGAPVLFVAPRYRYFIPINPWGFRFTQEAIWETDETTQSNTVFDLERKLPHDLFFRTSAGGTWISASKGYFYSLSFSLRHPLDSKRALDYSWSNSFQTRPVGELTEVFFSIRYRQNFWREWLFFEVAPQYRFPRDSQYKGTPGILFRLEMYFGQQA